MATYTATVVNLLSVYINPLWTHGGTDARVTRFRSRNISSVPSHTHLGGGMSGTGLSCSDLLQNYYKNNNNNLPRSNDDNTKKKVGRGGTS